MSTASAEMPDGEESHLTVDGFWDMANEVLYSKVYFDPNTGEYVTIRPDSCSSDEMNMIIVSYISLCTTHSEEIGSLFEGGVDSFHYSAAKLLIDCSYYQENLGFCIRKLLSLLNYIAQSALTLAEGIEYDKGVGHEIEIKETLNMNQRMVRTIGWILYINYTANNSIMTVLEEFQGFITICETLTCYCKLKEKLKDLPEYSDAIKNPYYSTYSNFLELLYEICKNSTISSEDLAAVDICFLEFLFKSLTISTRDEDELNFLKFKLLLVMNEQYMVSFYSSEEAERIPNKAFNAMIEGTNFRNFSECLMLNFNREKDHIIQILMLKVLYMVFTTSSTCQWFYLNDLKVLVDIFLRELNDLSLVEDEALINTYLRVIYPMLMFSVLKSESYKKESLVEVMRYLNSAEESAESTKRLSGRCLELRALKFADEGDLLRKSFSSVSSSNSGMDMPDSPQVAASMGYHNATMLNDRDDAISITSNSSNGSSTKPRKRAPPPPLPRKMLGSRNSSSSDVALARTGRRVD
ncbi:unnamed protein product [Kuraishia capsulata CBS 1993]|uniref:SPIN90/Ldb17 leucine-rich domain-containing protein n=1 Tax=Kuraishia capsulata CBS 1993 TaxID=1382522 RepID=W6MKT0_9ASCO|nr:uncharacterized protein KUCA_T00001336001 [Kuraishia capsulata CBS 1993]CDK25367.1 unnamed protein product [Kuraishia capsulata CBS 1993]